MIRLGVNIDHVATVRQARGEVYPDPVQAAAFAVVGGADNITCHLREDRRHIQDRDVRLLRETIGIPLNFEMACTDEMLAIAKQMKPAAVTLVPEKREERTTEGGLDVGANKKQVTRLVAALKESGIVVALFIEPDLKAVDLSAETGADAVEFHTGTFCKKIDTAGKTSEKFAVTATLQKAAKHAMMRGLQCHFGHGLHYGNANWLQTIPGCEEANIGHAIVARALFVGMTQAVREMKDLLNNPVHKPVVPG